jgi:hypothetical protein
VNTILPRLAPTTDVVTLKRLADRDDGNVVAWD